METKGKSTGRLVLKKKEKKKLFTAGQDSPTNTIQNIYINHFQEVVLSANGNKRTSLLTLILSLSQTLACT